MGDYLGATICVTEVYLLTMIALMPHVPGLITFMTEIVTLGSTFMGGSVDFKTIVDEFLRDERKIALLKFITVGIFTTIWCSFVGHPPVFVRKTVEKKGETNEIQISLQTDEEKKGEYSETTSDLQVKLSDPNSNFTSRYEAARLYLDSLAKPVGSLGTLEDWAARLASLQGTSRPSVNKAACLIFAADHGVAKDKSEGGENCSAYPQAVTRKVLEALEFNMAGASVLAAQNDVFLRVIDIGLVGDATIGSGKVVVSSEHKIIGGTANFCNSCAMSGEETDRCILAGRQEVKKCIEDMGVDVFVFGEVGIGNTTTSSALIAAITGEPVDTLCGSGATTTRDSKDNSMIMKKIEIVNKALAYHGASKMLKNPSAALKNVGGAEIAAMVGGILEASERNIPVLIDGFIVTTAAMIACQMNPETIKSLLFATRSTERGQAVAIDAIKNLSWKINIPAPEKPTLDMSLRMGEGTGGLIAVPILRSAAAVFSDLATLNAVLSLEADNQNGIC